MTRTTLVIGSSAMLGAATVDACAELGPVITAGRSGTDISFDLLGPAVSESARFAADAAIVVAADFGGPSDDDMLRATRANVVGVLRACRLAADAGANHIVLISTASATYSPGDAYYGIYALSKRQGEEMAELFCADRKMRLTVLRPTGIYDSHGRSRRHQGLLYAIVDAAQNGIDFTISGTNDPMRNFIHVDDVAVATRSVIETGLTGTHVCGLPTSSPVSEVASVAYEVFGNGGMVHFDADKPDVPDLPLLPDTSVFDHLPIDGPIDLHTGLRYIRDAAA